MGYKPQPAGDDITKIGALSEGFANTSTNDAYVDDSNVGTANGENRNNDYSDNSTDNSSHVDLDATVDVAVGNGDNRDNDYDWSYESKSYSDNDTITKTTTINDNDTDYDWSYSSKSYSDNDTTVQTITETDTKTFSYSDNDTSVATTTTTGSFNSSDSYYTSDDDFGNVGGVADVGNLGIAGGDLTFNLGDDFLMSTTSLTARSMAKATTPASAWCRPTTWRTRIRPGTSTCRTVALKTTSAPMPATPMVLKAWTAIAGTSTPATTQQVRARQMLRQSWQTPASIWNWCRAPTCSPTLLTSRSQAATPAFRTLVKTTPDIHPW